MSQKFILKQESHFVWPTLNDYYLLYRRLKTINRGSGVVVQ